MTSAFLPPLLPLRGAKFPAPSLARRPFCARRTARTQYCTAAGPTEGIRVNKCFKRFASRRESDNFIASGRVLINGAVAAAGARVFPGDAVSLDGSDVEWESLTVGLETRKFVYVKYWKEVGVICTTDASVENNIISRVPAGLRAGARLFPVGRLDETSSGVILLTSDGRLPNAALGKGKRCVKEYLVRPDMFVSQEDIERLREGVVISTVAQRDRGVKQRLVGKTISCEVERGEGLDIVMRLQEGRNRQIRKMLGALGYTARDIHRFGFMGIGLDGMEGPGDWQVISGEEMRMIEEKLGEV